MSRDKLLALRKKALASKAKTEDARAERQAKKAKKKAPPRLSEMTPSQRRGKTVNSTHVEAWFREGVVGIYGRNFVIPKWTVKQRKLAKMLLETYGESLVKNAVVHFCKTWDTMVRDSRGRLSGAPTVNLLWGMRERVFADVQNKDRKIVARKDSDEFKGDEGAPDVGW